MTIQDNGEGKGGCVLRVILGIWVVAMIGYLIWVATKNGGTP